MVQKLDDNQSTPPGNEYDGNQPAWREPFDKSSEELQDDYDRPSATDDDLPEGHPSRQKRLSPDQLEDAESAPWETNISGGEAKPQAGGAMESGLLSRLRSRSEGLKKLKTRKLSKQTKWLLFGFTGFSTVSLIAIAIFLFAALKIPNFAENITTYHMARTARLFNRSTSQINAERLGLNAVEDSRFGQLQNRYQSLRNNTWGKLDQYRPKRVMQNLYSEKILDYRFSEPEGIFRRQRLQAVIVNGQAIQPADERFGRYISNYREKIRFSAELDASLNLAMKENKTLVRSAVAKEIRESLGIKLRWWERKAANYKNKTQAETDRLLDREAKQRITQEPGGRALNSDVEDTADKTQDALDDCVRSDECLDEVRRNGGNLPDSVDSVILEGIGDSRMRAFNQALSTINAVFVPLCMIYEGSIQRAAPVIDAQNASLQRTYYAIASAADQQKMGDTNGEAVGAMNRKTGNIAASNSELRASGKLLQAQQFVGPQASTTGDYSIMDALLPQEVSNFFSPAADSMCPVIADVWVGAGLAVAEIAAGYFSGGGSSAAGQGVRTSVNTYIKQLAGSILSKKGMRRLVVEGATIGGTTFLARMLVLSRMGAQYNGLAQDVDFDNQADMGGDLNGEEQDRQMFYAAPLTNPEITKDEIRNVSYLNTKDSSKSTFERYASLSNPNSLLTNSIMRIGSTFQITSLQQLPQRLGGIFGSGISSIASNFSQRAYAADTANVYNIVNWGYTEEEEKLIENDISYYPLENQKILDDSGKEEAINNDYDECFTSTIGTLIGDRKIVREKDGAVVENQGKCSPQNLGLRNPTYGDLVFRWRLAKRNNNTLDHLLQIQQAGSQPAVTTYNQRRAGSIITPCSSSSVVSGGRCYSTPGFVSITRQLNFA